MTIDYHGKVRDRDPDSSWEAAGRQTDSRVGELKAVILTLFRQFGSMSDEALVDRYEAHRWLNPGVPQVTPQSIRTRRHELTVAGTVFDTRMRGTTRTGSSCTIWAAAL